MTALSRPIVLLLSDPLPSEVLDPRRVAAAPRKKYDWRWRREFKSWIVRAVASGIASSRFSRLASQSSRLGLPSLIEGSDRIRRTRLGHLLPISRAVLGHRRKRRPIESAALSRDILAKSDRFFLRIKSTSSSRSSRGAAKAAVGFSSEKIPFPFGIK
jgi:hypothetical protein